MFENLFEALGFEDQAQQEVTKDIIEISKKFGEQCRAINKVVRKIARQNLDILMFSKKNAHIMGLNHSKPLYVEAKVNSLTFKRALTNNGSSTVLCLFKLLRQLTFQKRE